MTFEDWCLRWRIPPQAIMELRHIHLHNVTRIPEERRNDSEEAVKSRVQLAGSDAGMILLRNNSGAFKNERDQWVRFGLGNVSKQFNNEYKSSDYIGIYPLYITPQYVGRTIGVFTAVETKNAAWRPKDLEGNAQARFLDVVIAHGGIGTFASHASHVINALERFKT